MNNIYNNLIKTEWFNQFDKQQKFEILIGIKANLDVSIYANPEIPAWEMEETRKKLFFAEKNNLIDFFV